MSRAVRADRARAMQSLGPAVLRRHALAPVASNGSKEDRGRVVVIGGHREIPGAVLLTATAALRAGAGKVQVATAGSMAAASAVAFPEGRVCGMEESEDGELSGAVDESLIELVQRAHVVCVGPGMLQAKAARSLLRALVPLESEAHWVVDGAAVCALQDEDELLARLKGRAVLTPHAGEMAGLLGITREAVERDPSGVAGNFVRRHGVVLALKGVHTVIGNGDGPLFLNKRGNAGLATAGSGDVLAGVVSGLVARGAPPLTAALWAVHAHAVAGERLARSIGPVGYLARELIDQVPGILARAVR